MSDDTAHDGAAAEAPRIWVDTDACPGVIREILFRAAPACAGPGHSGRQPVAPRTFRWRHWCWKKVGWR
ncbi:hypothetical protein ACFOLC_11985 [Lysobacter cavernae]|uniref:YaiI/YqxD family protein n=1 Tax=Lysobacter cavernae TaxID=1685901 RepID=A0ABV7RU52_9GAMM